MWVGVWARADGQACRRKRSAGEAVGCDEDVVDGLHLQSMKQQLEPENMIRE